MTVQDVMELIEAKDRTPETVESAVHGKLIRHKTLADGECNYWILGDKDPEALAEAGFSKVRTDHHKKKSWITVLARK